MPTIKWSTVLGVFQLNKSIRILVTTKFLWEIVSSTISILFQGGSWIPIELYYRPIGRYLLAYLPKFDSVDKKKVFSFKKKKELKDGCLKFSLFLSFSLSFSIAREFYRSFWIRIKSYSSKVRIVSILVYKRHLVFFFFIIIIALTY